MIQVKKLYYCPACMALQNRTKRDFMFESYCEKSGKKIHWRKVKAKKK